MTRPPFVVRAAEVPAVEGRYPKPFDAEPLTLGRDLGRAGGSRSLGTWHETLAPGRRTARLHAHLREEEHVYVLSGHPSLQWRPEGGATTTTPLAPGDLVVLPAGTGLAHLIVNESDADAEILVIGERRTGERIFYPADPELEAWRAMTGSVRQWEDHAGPDGNAQIPAYRIEVEGLVLRPWEPADARELFRLKRDNQAHLLPWMPWAAATSTIDAELALIRTFRAAYDRDEDYVLGVFLADGAPIGGTGLHPRVGPKALEIGYWIAEEHGRKGYARLIAAALTRVALEAYGVERVEIRVDPDNERSLKIPPRLGFVHEATLPRRVPSPSGALRDSTVWSMHRASFAGSPPSTLPVRAWDGAGRRLV